MYKNIGILKLSIVIPKTRMITTIHVTLLYGIKKDILELFY